MFYHICRFWQVCLFSVYFEFLILFRFSKPLIAADKLSLSNGLNQNYIESVDSGGDVLVNYRMVSQQFIKKGDVIKIGTALLQYYEV